jgi:hypothetical protein
VASPVFALLEEKTGCVPGTSVLALAAAAAVMSTNIMLCRADQQKGLEAVQDVQLILLVSLAAAAAAVAT